MIAFVPLLAGLGLVSAVRLRPRTGAGLVGGSLFLGVVFLALWTHLLLFVRIPVSLASVLAGAGAAGIAGAIRFDRTMFRVSWRPGWNSVPVFLSLAFLVYGAVSWNLLGYDGEVYYVLNAKSILHYGTFWNPDFTDPARLHPSARRPLLISCFYADYTLLAGTTDTRGLRLWFALLHAGALGVIHDRFKMPMLWLTVLAWLPAFWHDAGGVFTGYGDATLAVLILLGVGALAQGERVLSGGAFSAAVLLKQDAWPLLIAVPLATLAAKPRSLPRTLLVLIAPALLAIAWGILSSKLPPRPDIGNAGQVNPARLVASIPNWPTVLGRFGSEILKPAHWGFFWVVTAGGIGLMARHLTREDAWWLSIGLFQILAYAAVTTTYDPSYIHFAAKSQAMRLFLHVAPLFWFCVGRRWQEVMRSGSPACTRPATSA